MTETLPDPLVPADLDLRDFSFMPLHVSRLLASDTWLLANGDEAKAMMTLWARAWHQVPAGSLPNDDRLLAALSGGGAKWKKLRAVALRGFVACSDGRLYHRTICEEALASWEKKKSQRSKTAAATEARRRNATKTVTVDHDDGRDEDRNVDRHDHRDDARNVVQGTGTVEGTEEEKPTSAPQGRLDGASLPFADPAPPPADPAKPPAVKDMTDLSTQLYERGRQVLGKAAGGQITRLLAHCQGNVAKARAALETAATKADPASYIGGVLRGQRDPPSGSSMAI